VAGIAKGRKLLAPKSAAVRPTTDRIKEAIFSMLEAEAFRRADEADAAPDFPFHRVLDLYAGSGALGIEALSRGAEHADFVEANAPVRAVLMENLRRTGFASQATVIPGRVETALSTLRRPYDLILLDPPYGDEAAVQAFQKLGSSDFLTDRAIVILEHARTRAIPDQVGALELARSRHHGSTAISLFVRRNPSDHSDHGDLGAPP
jgi:16S rRNA (guanine966-N2)-methyltransferase